MGCLVHFYVENQCLDFAIETSLQLILTENCENNPMNEVFNPEIIYPSHIFSSLVFYDLFNMYLLTVGQHLFLNISNDILLCVVTTLSLNSELKDNILKSVFG